MAVRDYMIDDRRSLLPVLKAVLEKRYETLLDRVIINPNTSNCKQENTPNRLVLHYLIAIAFT